MSLFFQSPESIRNESPTLDSMIKRQRSLMLVCFAVLMLGTFFFSVGGCQEQSPVNTTEADQPATGTQDPDADSAESGESQAGDAQDASGDQADTNQQSATDNGDPVAENNPDALDLDFSADPAAELAATKRKELEREMVISLRNQKAAQVTEAVSILAYPWHERRVELARAGKWLDESKAWVPPLVHHIGTDLCDRNRALENSSHLNGQQMMPRCRGGIDPVALEMMGYGSYCKHLVIVEFLEEGKGWRVHGYRFAMKHEEIPEAIERAWPKSNVSSHLIADIAQMTETLTTYKLHTADVFTHDDTTSKAFAEMEWALDQDLQVEASNWLRTIRKRDPAFTYPLYRRVHEWANPNTPGHYDLALQLLTQYYRTGGSSARLRSFLVAAIHAQSDTPHRELAFEIAGQVIEEDRLNMAAYTARLRMMITDGNAARSSLRQAIQHYPQDGRYHTAYGKEINTDPSTIEEAIEMGQQAIELRPWNYKDITQHGITLLNYANAHHSDRDYPRDVLYMEYERAAQVLGDGWRRNPNEVGLVLDFMVDALTRGGTMIDHLSEIEKEYVYAFAFISQILTDSALSRDYLGLFTNMEWRARVHRDFVSQAVKAKMDDPQSEIPLLMACCVRLYEVQGSAQDYGKVKQLIPTVHATIKKYRDFGGRNSKIEDLWEQIYYDTSHAQRIFENLYRQIEEARKAQEGNQGNPPLRKPEDDDGAEN